MYNIISYGGGTQSKAMTLMALNGVFDIVNDDNSITPNRPDFAVFADTGGEPEFINEYVRYFKDYCKNHYDFDIYIIMKGKGLVHRLLKEEFKTKSGKFYSKSTPPYFTLGKDGNKGMLNRQCTSDYKVHPISAFITKQLGRNIPYNLWMGISFEERSRMRISPIKKRFNYYPLVDNYIKRMDSVKYVIKQGLRSPQRSSCYFCPFHSDRYWRWLKKQHPEEFKKAVDFEKQVQTRQNDSINDQVFIHRECINLDMVNFDADTQLDLFPELIDECEGYCGI